MSQSCDDQLNKLVKPNEPNRKPLDPAKERAEIPADRSTGVAGEDAETGEGSIASPLTEKSREYYDTQSLVSSDGFVVLEWFPVKKIKMEDDNGLDVELKFSEP